MESCNCVEPQWPADDLHMRYQYISDFFIPLAYFSIPLELIYFVKKSSIFPYRWVLVQFGAFLVLCGATHLINLWTFSAHTRVKAVALTVAKIFTAAVSCATSLMLIHIIPDLLSVKTRELFSKNKAAELDREMGLIRTQENGRTYWPDSNKQPFAVILLMLPSDRLEDGMSMSLSLSYEVVADQTALNVVGNAVKFTKEGSISIKVSLQRAEYLMDPLMPEFYPVQGERHCYIRVEVQDTGVGLNLQDIPKLFNKFLQADSTTTRNYSGTGLGLAICKRLVNLMDSHIWVESEGIEKGTLDTFVVKLGLPENSSELDHQMATVMQPSHLRTDFMGVRVLVTHDNGSSQEWLQIISQPGQSLNVLLLDVCMPDKDGYEVGIHIQEKFAQHECPLLVALTTNTDMATWEQCLSLGMDRVILKPISLEKMQMVLTELLGFGSLNDNHWRT
ncbi:unnamed protein product [Sphagnum troendelagicum]|uniref:Ethylene receptor n=1 Tax=Sphagnum troendelagicum TaxID=128251 RepID=A0ABP0TJH4_9BRYO